MNYGLRFDYEGPVHTGQPNLSIFDPSLTSGLAVTGVNVANIYPKFRGAYSPRVGFSYQLGGTSRSVPRGGHGLYNDSIYMKSILENENLRNVSDFGPELNPDGSSEVATASALNTAIQSGAPIYETYAQALAGAVVTSISTFDQHFRPAYMQTFDLNIEHAFTPSVIWKIGYVGTKGTHLLRMFDINAGALNSLNVPIYYNNTSAQYPKCPAQYSGAVPGTASTDAGGQPPFKYSFSLSHKRLEDGGSTRQMTVRDLAISKKMAGVEMRLIAGGVRELHWHPNDPEGGNLF